MNLIINSLKQQLIGTVNLTVPLIIIAYCFPSFISNTFGALACALLIGLYVFYLQYKATVTHKNSLKFSPSGAYKEELEQHISDCSINCKDIKIQYAFSNEMICMNMFNTIVIDPIIWQDPDRDQEMIKVKNIIDQHILPGLSDYQKNRIIEIRQALSIPAQRFIFKHELGHFHYNYTNKKLILTGFIALISTYIGISVANLTISSLGIISILLGMIVGSLIDLILSYSSNVFFKLVQERKADIFAATYSSEEDTLSAIEFFEKHQQILDTYTDQSSNGVISKLPKEVLSGYDNGKARADRLREFVAKI